MELWVSLEKFSTCMAGQNTYFLQQQQSPIVLTPYRAGQWNWNRLDGDLMVGKNASIQTPDKEVPVILALKCSHNDRCNFNLIFVMYLPW